MHEERARNGQAAGQTATTPARTENKSFRP
jgi:hypothetical protein